MMDLVASAPWQMWVTLAVIAITIVFYASDRFPIELISAGSLGALLLLFQLAPLYDQAGEPLLSMQSLVAGFASPALIAIMSLLIIGQGIFQSGGMELPTKYLMRAFEKQGTVVTASIYLIAFAISAFLNDTPVVVMFIPLVAAIAAQGRASASQLMMPLSFIALFGGMTTLIGSSTNLLAAASFKASTGQEIGFFELTPMALVIGGIGIVYLATAGRFLLPKRANPDAARERESKQFIAQIDITPGHPLVGKGAVSGLFPDLPDVTVRMVLRRGEAILPPYDDFAFRPHDVLIIAATRAALTNLLKSSPDILDGLMAETPLDVEGAAARSSQLTMVEFADHYARICDVVDVPVFGDMDTGFGNVTNAVRTIRAYEKAGLAGAFIEDQVFPKRCGHMTGKAVVPVDEMVAKLKAVLDARQDPDFVVMARTDALAVLGLDEAIERANLYREVGADMLFVEAPRTVDDMRRICSEIEGPCMANNIETGLSPLLPSGELESIGYASVALPVGALYAVTHMLRGLYGELRETGSTEGWLDRMVDFEEFAALVGLPELRRREQELADYAAETTRP